MSAAEVRAVRVRPGDGRLCRTATGVVFTPAPAAGWDEMVAAAHQTGADDLVAAVAEVLARRELDAPPVAVITWQPRVAVLVFGDVELSSDHPAVPLLTGRGSRTWVEHSLPGGAEQLQLSVVPPEDTTDTDLRGGVVPAGGLRVELSRRPARTGDQPTPAAVAGHGEVDRAGAPVGDVPAAPVDPPRSADPAPAQQASATPTERIDTSDWRPPTSTSDDPEDVLGLIQAAAVVEDQPDRQEASPPAAPAAREDAPPPAAPSGVGGAPSPPDPVPAPADPVPASSDPVVAPADPDPGRRPLVDAVRCPAGHASPPGSSTCRSCGALLAPGAPTAAVPRPVLGVAVFDDGVAVPVDGDVVLGRRPPADGRTAHVVEGDRVSRHHAELQVRGWDVLLHDPGSRNGTYVVPPGADDPFRVDPEVPTRLELGSRVYLGTRSFRFEGSAGSPAGSDDDATVRP